ncbi:monoacylglycerol lipase ABHD6-like [Neosynchiropus ocellatus]
MDVSAAGSLLVLVVLGAVISVLVWPKVLILGYAWVTRQTLGLVIRYSHCGDYRFCYAIRGTLGGATTPILFLHGFSSSKDGWHPLVTLLPRNQCVVCVDMPGHAGTSRIPGDDYTIQGQVTRIHQFVKSIGLDKRPFHLVGMSMGGAVAGVYAADHSSHLTSVTLICPGPGLDSPVKNEIIAEMKQRLGQKASIAAIPTTPEELRRMMNLFSYTERKVPSLIIRGVLDMKRPNSAFYRQVCEDLGKPQSVLLLQDKMHLISVPLQVIWGRNDMLIHHSGASLLQAAKPNCQVTLLDNCGHSVLLDKPREAADLIMNFLSSEKNQ